MGLAVGSHAWLFLMAPLVLTAFLGTGWIYLRSETEESLEEQDTPSGSPAKAEWRFVQAHFFTNESHLFSPFRSSAEVNFTCILVVSNTANLLDQVISEMSQLDEAGQTLTVPWGDGTQVFYPQVCARYKSTCIPSNPLPFIWQKNNNMDLKSITFPICNTSNAPRYWAGLLGGTILGPGSGISQLLLQAKAVWLQYYLKTTEPKDSAHSQKWLLEFLDQIHAIEK